MHPPGNSSPAAPRTPPGLAPRAMRRGSPRSAYPGEPRPGRPRRERLLAGFSASRPRICLRARWLEPTRHPGVSPTQSRPAASSPRAREAAREHSALPCGAAGAGPASSAGTRGWPGMNESARSTHLDRSQGAGRPLLQLLSWPGPELRASPSCRPASLVSYPLR